MPGSSSADRTWLVASFVGLACLLVYLPRLYPSVPGGDAGELIVAAARLEVAHPPGYPLYTVLAHVATWLPFGSIAWRVSLFSALCQAGAAALVAATVVGVTGSVAAALTSGLLFAFSPVVWTHAVGAEVFALHDLLVAALLFFTLRWSQRRRAADAIAITAVVGLGLAHHHTIVFYAGPVLVWLLWCGPELRTGRRLATMALAIGAGLAWYLYLPLAARKATTLSWGDPSTWQGFVDHLLRRDYGTFQLAAGVDPAASSFAARLAAWGEHTLDATLGIGALFVLVGVAVGLLGRRENPERGWVGMWVVGLAVYVLGFHALANLPVGDPLYRAVTARFWQQSDVVVFVLLGLGLGTCLDALPRATRIVGVAIAAFMVAVQLGRGLGVHDHRADDTVARFGRALLEPLEPDALLLTRGDLVTNVVRYLQAIDGVRTDVTVLDQELLTKPWYVARAAREHPALRFPGVVYDPARPDGFSMRTFLDANAGNRAIAVYPEWKTGDPSVDGVYELSPAGLALDVDRVGLAFEARHAHAQTALRVLDEHGWQRIGLSTPGTWERVAREDVWHARARFGWWLLTQALARDDPRLFNAARVQLERAERGHPDPPAFLFRNLGIAYERLALREPKLREQQLVAWRRYLAIAPPDDDGRAAIAATVARLEAEER